MILFLQRHSIVQLLLHLDLFVRAEAIYVYGRERRFSAFDTLGISARLGNNALALLGFARKVKLIDTQLLAPELWRANYDSIELAEQCARDFLAQDCYAFLSAYLGHDPALINYFKARYVLYASRALHLVRLVEALARTGPVRVLIAHEEFATLPNAPRLFDRLAPWRTKRSRAAAAITGAIHGAWYRLQWLSLPLGRLLLSLPRLRFRPSACRSFTLAMQVHWGAPRKTGGSLGTLKAPQHDFYLYSGRIREGELLHYYDGSWSFNREFRAQCNAYMTARGYTWADRSDLHVTPLYAMRLLKLQGTLLVRAFRSRLMMRDSASVQNVCARALMEVLDREFDLEHFRWRTLFDRTDYNPRHIIDTIVLNRAGGRTIGLHHCASPYDSPQIAFVHYDRYITVGAMFERLYGRWWRPDMVCRIGRNNIDWVVRPRHDAALMASLQSRFEAAARAPHRYRVTLLVTGEAYYLFPGRWAELERGLRQFVASNLDAALVVRFKGTTDARRSPHLSRLRALGDLDPRLIFEQPGFSTYELMAISDLVIAPNCSSAINEALALDVPVFTFDYHGRTALVFPSYGRDFVLTTGEQLFDRLASLPRGYAQYDVNWEQLKRDANYTADGRNHERTADFVATVALGEAAPATRHAEEVLL